MPLAALAFYVSGYRNTVSDTVAACDGAAPDGRLVLNCVDGFFHEFERANLLLDDAIGQNFMPTGVSAPCDHDSGTLRPLACPNPVALSYPLRDSPYTRPPVRRVLFRLLAAHLVCSLVGAQ